MEIIGEICWMVADPPTAAIMMTLESAVIAAVRPVGAAPGGLIVLAIAPENAEKAEIPTGVAGPAVTVRIPLLKAMT
jgi:hypothetical protein